VKRHNLISLVSVFFILLASMAMTGCMTMSKDFYRSKLAWDPVLSSQIIEANVLIETECKFTPDFTRYWKKFMNTDESISNYKQASCDAIMDDMVRSRIFKRVVPPGDTN